MSEVELAYSHEEHMHRYACWAAARAAQRGWEGGTAENIRAAIDKVDLRGRLSQLEKEVPDDSRYQAWHSAIAKDLIVELENRISEAKYGRVAKIIAIYIKTIYVVRDPMSPLSQVAYPPVDRKLLLEVKSCKDTPPYDHSVSWTTFDEQDHDEAIEYLRQLVRNQPFWEVERYWRG